VACRTARVKGDLVRVVRAPGGELGFDDTGRRPGRGAYLCRDGSCWATALRRGALQRALGVPLPPDLRAALEAGPETANMILTMDTRTTTTTGEGDRRGEE